MRLLRSSLRKLVGRPATGRIVLLLAAFLALIYLSLGLSSTAVSGSASKASIAAMLTFPDAHASLAGMLLIFCGMAGAAYAGVIAGSEWSWNTFRVALTRGESRVRYVVGLFVAIAVLAFVAWILLYVLGVALILVAAALGGSPAGAPLAGTELGRVGVLVLSGGWAVLMEVAIGFGVAFVARSSVAGIAAVVGLFFVERFAEMFVPADVLRFAPISAAEDLVAAAGRAGLDGGLMLPLVVTSIYLLLAVGVAGLAARRAEVA
jgi:hypothetical protein